MPVAPRKIPPPSDDKRWRLVDATMRRYGCAPNALIETLHTLREAYGVLEPKALGWQVGHYLPNWRYTRE